MVKLSGCAFFRWPGETRLVISSEPQIQSKLFDLFSQANVSARVVENALLITSSKASEALDKMNSYRSEQLCSKKGCKNVRHNVTSLAHSVDYGPKFEFTINDIDSFMEKWINEMKETDSDG